MDYNGYCVRVDALDGYADKIAMLSAHSDFQSIVGVKHLGTTKENPHYHFVIKTVVKDQAFRVRLRQIFNAGKGNGHMSIKSWDGRPEAISYLFHEDPDAVLVIQYNVSDETISEAKVLNRQVQQMVLDAKTKASWRAEEIVYEQLVKERAGWRDFCRPSGFTDVQIATRLILTCLRTGKYAPQQWLVRAMTERIQFKLLNGVEEDEQLFAYRIAKNIFYDK